MKSRAGAAASGPDRFIEEHGHRFGLTNPGQQLGPAQTVRDPLGYTRTSYKQVHQGVPVFAGVLRIHQDRAGRFRAANGRFFPVDAKLSTVPTVPAARAEQVARKLLGKGAPALEQAELVIVDPGWYGDPPTGPRLAWHIILNGVPAAVREAFFIDAHTGNLLDRWNLIHQALYREIHDANGGAALPGPIVRIEGQPLIGIEDANRAYDYAGDTYDYFFRAFGRDSLDGQGLPLVITVNSTAPICPNAFWNGHQMVFCAGMVADDIMAHELVHGLTQYAANLVYQNQSGQLNEAFSDIFGELVDLFNGDAAFLGGPGGSYWPETNTGPGNDYPNELRLDTCSLYPAYSGGYRWLVGEDSDGGAFRDMWNPPCHENPDKSSSPFQTCNPYDNGGVHSGVGIPTHAFAIMTDGKTFNGYTVTGIGPIKSGAVWYRALTTYLTPASDFEDAYAAVNQSAQDLIGSYPNDPRTGLPSASVFTSDDAMQVDNAMRAVEMNGPGGCGATVPILNSTPPVLCGPNRHIIFSDDFENGANGWTVSNTNPPTPYDWEQTTTSLPFDRPGKAWFCKDPNLGDCTNENQAGAHYLTSPPIQLPSSPLDPTVTFTHHMVSEPRYDGGNVKISINEGVWQMVPQSAFSYNSYNSSLYSSGSSNPLAGQPAWTGAGGEWGTSVIRLNTLVTGGETIRLRFEFGKDGCNGLVGWYVDDFQVFTCPCTPPTAEGASVRTPQGTPIDIVLSAQDDGQPVPPGALMWIITALPAAGTLEDPGFGPIAQVPHALANHTNVVKYTPGSPSYRGPDAFTFAASDGGTPPEGGQSNTAEIAIQVGPLEYFTEQFTDTTGDHFDLSNRMLTLRPQAGQNGYMACMDYIPQLPVGTIGHTLLTLDDDEFYQASLTGGQTVWLYGQPCTTLFIGSNGYVVLDANPEVDDLTSGAESPATHFMLKRVSALFDDLNPSDGGQIFFAQLSDRAVATWKNVPEFGTGQLNTFQIELFFDGTIRISWEDIDAVDGLAGISRGTGVPADWQESDLSKFRRCQPGDFDLDGDVDQTDFGHMQSCLTGPGLPQGNPACQNAWMDADLDVDPADVQLFRTCFSGPGVAADPSCAN